MNDNRVGQHTIRNYSHQLEPCNELDVLANSESAHIQEFRLYRELSREIEKNSNDRVRYVESDLFQRNQHSSESRPADVSEGPGDATLNTKSIRSNLKSNPDYVNRWKQSFSSSSSSSNKTQVQASTSNRLNSNNDDDRSSLNGGGAASPNGLSRSNQKQRLNSESDDKTRQKSVNHDGSCQVCLVKGLRDDLMHVTRVIQEKNEQLLNELKAKKSRSFLERLDQ